MGSESFLSDNSRKQAESKFSVKRKAKLGKLEDYLSIQKIMHLMFPVTPDRPKRSSGDYKVWRKENFENLSYRKGFKKDLIKACAEDKLKYEGNIKGWKYSGENPFPLAGVGKKRPNRGSRFICRSSDCSIHKDEFKRFYQAEKKWPLDSALPSCGDLAKWYDNKNMPRINKNQKRNNGFESWMREKNPCLKEMSWDEIHKELKERDSQLWGHGFDGWKKQQSYYKGKPGKRKG